MARDTSKNLEGSAPHILEQLVRGEGLSPLLISGAQIPLKGAYLVTFTADLANALANTATLQEFTLTDTSDDVQIEVGDLFIPFGFANLDAGLTLANAAAETAHKVPLMVVNSTVGAIDEASATVTVLWLDIT